MKLLILFALTSCALAYGWGCGCSLAPVYPFLRGASREARNAFWKIINDRSLTKNELEEKLKEWAKEFDLTDKYERFAKRAEEQKQQTQEEIKKAMEKLTDFFDKLKDIENDKSLTVAEAKKKTRQLYDTLNAKSSRAASCIAGAFAPEIKCDDYNDGWFGGFGGMWRRRYGRSVQKQNSPANFASFLKDVGLGYPWYTGSYRVQ
ncbi:hypothetical protein ANCCAN_07017 [Ancylostoma caninum]|uniref:SXP/RAL-2 family protein Ani s 5-like cation-binding domain-containing protein n=1 Tax=Ancylostoma caninum TaxID=29170 RepID=A0A368GVI9_ANCCA|nr:hypothetical protein ANCCAN_07017 [Ancylostoma caninum]